MAFPLPLAVDKLDTGRSTAPTGEGELQMSQYQTVGETLLICEACCFKVGIPWLPPTKKVRELGRRYQPPLEDFIRISLVTVNTKTLEAYCDDLESSRPNKQSAQALHLRMPPALERFSLCALLFIVFFALTGWITVTLDGSQEVAAVSALLIGAAGSAIGAFSCLEPQRRNSFSALLNRELLRRRGVDPTNSNRLNLLSLET